MAAIKLRVSNQKAYVWDIKDVQALRVQHHVCGILVGTLPQVSQQNVFLGLPLVLLPEEVALLVRNQLGIILDDNQAHRPPTPGEYSYYHSSRLAAIEHQKRTSVALEAIRKAEAAEKYKDEIAAKQAERQEKKRKKAEQERLARQTLGEFIVNVPELKEGEKTTGPPSSLKGKEKEEDDLATVPYTIITQPSSSDLPWYDAEADNVSYDTLQAAKTAGIWDYPETPLQESRCQVFEDLWRKGYYMGGGLRFGGDFLIYPGDPLRYHSHFTLTTLTSPKTPIMPLDLVAYGRLATGVKKAHLLASWDKEKGEATYFSLEWAAFG
ncbi:hypothetical protein T439DRAFT_328126 [Meredithblackwellia eburnea MCA 4105]